jgi:hypothetical protein
MIRVPVPDDTVAWVADRGFVGDDHDAAAGVERGALVLRATNNVINAPDQATAALMRIDAARDDLLMKLIDISEFMNDKLTGS